jgi:hypothetical protein
MVYKFITRSKGVVIFAVSLIALGSFNTFLVTLSILLLPLNDFGASGSESVVQSTISMPVFWLSTILSLLIYISWVISGVGALHLKEWARHLLRITMGAYIVNMLVNIVLNVFLAEEVMSKIPVKFLVAGIVITMSYYLGVIYFFSHPDIVRQFRFKSKEY